MTARDFSDRFKPFLPVGRIAQEAGFLENTWYVAASRGRDLTEDELRRLRAAVEAHADTLRELAADLT
ncbi:MAG: hypothetical protein AAGF99_01015 [Bacteroidota bacterium]